MQTKTAGLQVDMRLLEENGRFDRAEMVQFWWIKSLDGPLYYKSFIPKQLSSETQTTAIWKEKMKKKKTIVSFFFQMVYMYFPHFCIWYFLLFFSKIKLWVCYRVSRFKSHGLDGRHSWKKHSPLDLHRTYRKSWKMVWKVRLFTCKEKKGQRYYINLPRSKIKLNKRNFAFYDS